MGADVTFYKGDESFYFRDSYNSTNLAWVIGLSYWKDGGKESSKSLIRRKEFFRRLGRITDEQIKIRVNNLYSDLSCNINRKENPKEWIKMFKDKRADIRKHIKLINNAERVEWSV